MSLSICVYLRWMSRVMDEQGDDSVKRVACETQVDGGVDLAENLWKSQ